MVPTSLHRASHPSNTLRIMAWGASSNASPNPEDATPAASNTELLSIQNSVSSLTPTADVRNRYFMPGSTWTLNGLAPTTSYGNPGNTGGNGIGTSLIGNSTMETYFQPANTSFTTQLGNCLVCHQIYPYPQNYVRMTARVPVFNKSNPAKWTATGQYQTTQLALVGMHVVGSAAGHPEMIWSTFEHFGNTPNGAYQYINGANKVVAVPQNTSGFPEKLSSKSMAPFTVGIPLLLPPS